MELLKKNDLAGEILPGRLIKKAVGKDSPCESGKMTVGFGKYSQEYGKMAPHQHAEETVYIVSTKGGYFRYGTSPEKLGPKNPLSSGMLIHFDELEWHVFEYDLGGHVEIMFIYGQVTNIRPEEILENSRR
jgi:hypothetical protein